MNPRLTKAAEAKLDQLLRTNPQADIAGVVLRIDNQVVTVTREGRVQWFEQDGLGGIKRDNEEGDPRPPSQVMADINAKHGRKPNGER